MANEKRNDRDQADGMREPLERQDERDQRDESDEFVTDAELEARETNAGRDREEGEASRTTRKT